MTGIPGKLSNSSQVDPPSWLTSISELKASKQPKMSCPCLANETKNQGGEPSAVSVHGGSPVALEKTPTFVPTSQRSPAHSPARTASPGRKRSLPSRESDQSACPGSRKNAVPLKPPPASKRESLAAIMFMLVAC